MDTLTSFSVIALAALIHASFQLGVSVITLLSSHNAGKKVRAEKTLRLVGAFTGGVVVLTSLLFVTLVYFASTTPLVWSSPVVLWTVLCGALIGVGISVWAFYYRRKGGTQLWIPRAFARYLDTRVKKTTLSVEAFSLGLTTVVAELPFMAAPLVAAALAVPFLPVDLQLAGILLYVAVASCGTLAITILIGSGHNISRIQRWRETNKRFLQFVSGSGLIILGFYLYANQVTGIHLALSAAGVQ